MARRRREETSDPFAAIGCSDAVPVASGGSSVVYRARQVGFDRYVAVKVLTTPLLDERAQRRFERELALSGRLSGHPNVVTVYASGILPDRRPYVIMDFCSGGSLADGLARAGPLPVPHALAIAIKLAGVLDLAAQQGIVHRDVKPGNVLVTRFGEPALSDFGIAVLAVDASAATHSLTPVHAAPEVLEGQTVGPAADQWSLASTLHTLLSGRPPFAPVESEGLLAGMLHVLNDPVPPIPRADVPATLSRVLERALAKQPGGRWPDAGDFGRALQGVERAQGWGPTTMPTMGLGGGTEPPPAAPALDVDVEARAPSASPWVAGLVATGDGDQRARPSRPGNACASPLRPRRLPLPPTGWPTATPRTGTGADRVAAPHPPIPRPSTRGLRRRRLSTHHRRPRRRGGRGPSLRARQRRLPARRRPSTSPARGPNRRRRRPSCLRRGWRPKTLWTAGAVAVVVVLVVVGFVVVGSGGHHHHPLPPATTVPPAGFQVSGAQVCNETPTTATVCWTPPPCSICAYVVQTSYTSGGKVVYENPSKTQATSRTVVFNLAPSGGYCFSIGTISGVTNTRYVNAGCIRNGYSNPPPSPPTSAPAGVP